MSESIPMPGDLDSYDTLGMKLVLLLVAWYPHERLPDDSWSITLGVHGGKVQLVKVLEGESEE